MLSKSQLKYIQSLHHKKFREEEQAFLVEGTKMLEEAVHFATDHIQHIYAVPEWVQQHDQLLKGREHLLEMIEPEDMDRISIMQTPPGVLLVLTAITPIEHEFNGLTLILDAIQDPGNLGTIIRTADWFGITNIICGTGTVEALNPKVIQATMGSIFRVNLFYRDLEKFLENNKEIPIAVSHLEGTELSTFKWPEKLFLVIGNESQGVSPSISQIAKWKIKIPGIGHTESLNASVAASIFLYEWAR